MAPIAKFTGKARGERYARLASDKSEGEYDEGRGYCPSGSYPPSNHSFSSTSMTKGGLYPTLGVSSPFDTSATLVTSPVLSPAVLAAVRLVFATYGLTTALFVLIWDGVKLHTADTYVSVPLLYSTRPT